MKNEPIPIEWLVCPVTKEPLLLEGDETLRSSCGHYRRHPEFGFWNFYPEHLEALSEPEWRTWSHLQENGLVSYEADPTNNLGVGKRDDFAAFSDFCKLRGNVLDVGVGPQQAPSHLEYGQDRDFYFVGIDPLVGAQPKNFEFLQGLGEYLPFRNDLFDQVLFVTSLDHFIDPVKPLIEARRVIRADGSICVWIGEKDDNAPAPTQTHEWYEKLSVPEGAEDRFHFKRFTKDEFLDYVRHADLHVVDHEIQEVTPWKRNHFFRLQSSDAE